METVSSSTLEISANLSDSPVAFVEKSLILSEPPPIISKEAIRTSLKASTFDGIFAAMFSCITGGVLLTNFLLKLGANPVEIGMLSSIPMLVNLLQPLGAYFADRTTSRYNYCLRIFGASRLLWLVLVAGIAWIGWSGADPQLLVNWTIGIILAASILSGIGGSAWVSWMAVLVPHRLRGRYFGFRNSLASLTTLIGIPLLGFAVSAWPGGTIQGYGVVLFFAILAGLVSLGCQFFMADVNPQNPPMAKNFDSNTPSSQAEAESIFQDTNFLKFLLYLGLWMFAVNLSNPFFNLYLLDNLALDISWATMYTSLGSVATLIMLMLWGKLADRLGNRPLLLLVGILVAVTPLFWLGTGTDNFCLWVWLPLLHLLGGGTGAAIDLCIGNIQMEIAPKQHPTKYFAIAAAVAGVSGALGTTTGGFLAGLSHIGGLPGLFALSAVVRLLALLPLIFVREPRSQSVVHIMQNIFKFKPRMALVPAGGADPTKL